MSTFSKGDQVRCVETWTTYVIDSGDKFTVDDVRATVSGVQQVYVQGEWVPACYFEKVEPEFVVGQHVKDGDYALLPVGAKVDDDVTKTSAEGWTWDVDGVEWPNKEWYSPRTLTHLPETPEPEDTDDVEPEPLKNGEWTQAWVRVVDARTVDGEITVCLPRLEEGYRYFGGAEPISEDAIVRPSAGQVPPWVKPVEEPTADYAIIRDGFRTLVRLPEDQRGVDEGSRPWVVVGSNIVCAWDDIEEPVIVSGGAS